MCRMLVVNNASSGLIQAKTRMYVNLCGLPVEMHMESSSQGALQLLRTKSRFDILVTNIAENGQGYDFAESARSVQPWIKNIFILDLPSIRHPSDSQNACFLQGPMDMEGFYLAFAKLSPETARKAAAHPRTTRWQGGNDALLERILEILDIIEKEYQDDISLDYLAERVHTSPCYLSALFSKFMGISLLSYINDYRMQRATQLLAETDIKVKDICYLVGYRNPPYFCTSFKNKYNVTPAQYRRQCAAA